VVVGAALFSDGKVLAARRTAPPALAGRWEFPGGKVEPDESEPQALIRELWEELALKVRVIELLGRAQLGDGRELALYLSRPTGGCAQPDVDHDCVRWLSPAELSSVTWLDADRLLLSVVGQALRREIANGPS
jgi:8-oxo-dGTP diphosphatase